MVSDGIWVSTWAELTSVSVHHLMINWWSTDDQLMINWWSTDDELMMNWWWTDDELHSLMRFTLNKRITLNKRKWRLDISRCHLRWDNWIIARVRRGRGWLSGLEVGDRLCPCTPNMMMMMMPRLVVCWWWRWWSLSPSPIPEHKICGFIGKKPTISSETINIDDDDVMMMPRFGCTAPSLQKKNCETNCTNRRTATSKYLPSSQSSFISFATHPSAEE